MEKVIISADPGKNGAFVCLTEQGVIYKKMVMPISPETDEMDVEKVVDFIVDVVKELDPSFVIFVVENVHPLFQVSAKSTGSFMKNKGMIEGVFKTISLFVTGYHTEFIYIAPKTWQKVVWNHVDKVFDGGKVNTKATSLRAFNRIFPGVSPLKNDRCFKAHDGIVDAALIAEAARIKFI